MNCCCKSKKIQEWLFQNKEFKRNYKFYEFKANDILEELNLGRYLSHMENIEANKTKILGSQKLMKDQFDILKKEFDEKF